MTKEEEVKMMDEMKLAMADKTECMVSSYGAVVNLVLKSFDDKALSVEHSEVLKRADMFWNIALQRIDKEVAESKQHEQMIMQQSMPARSNQMTPPVYPDGSGSRTPKSPCQQKAEARAKEAMDAKDRKIATLEAKIVKQEK